MPHDCESLCGSLWFDTSSLTQLRGHPSGKLTPAEISLVVRSQTVPRLKSRLTKLRVSPSLACTLNRRGWLPTSTAA